MNPRDKISYTNSWFIEPISKRYQKWIWSMYFQILQSQENEFRINNESDIYKIRFLGLETISKSFQD